MNTAGKGLQEVKGSIKQTHGDKGLEEVFMTVDALILVDVSSSMCEQDVEGEGGKTSRWEEAGRQLRILQGRYPGRLAVVSFASDVEFRPDGTLPHASGSTNLQEALSFIQPADGAGIKFIVVGDGEPDSPDGALHVARKMTTPIDTIHVGKSEKGRLFMEELARASKGKSVHHDVKLLSDDITKLLEAGKEN